MAECPLSGPAGKAHRWQAPWGPGSRRLAPAARGGGGLFSLEPSPRCGQTPGFLGRRGGFFAARFQALDDGVNLPGLFQGLLPILEGRQGRQLAQQPL